MQVSSGKQTSVKQGQRGRILLPAGLVLVLLAALPEVSRPSVLKSPVTQAAKDFNQTSVNRPVEPAELLRQALANFNARAPKVMDYTYLEYEKLKSDWAQVSSTYEIMQLRGLRYRRHLKFNDQPLPPEDEKEEKIKLEAANREMMEEYVKIPRQNDKGGGLQSKEMPPCELSSDPQIAVMRSTCQQFKKQVADNSAEYRRTISTYGIAPPHIESYVAYKRYFPDIRLDELPLDDFSVRLSGHKDFDDRATYVLEANPRHAPRSSNEEERDVLNFKLRIWIDQADAEIVKVEGKAIYPGLLSTAEYSLMESEGLSKEVEVRQRKLLQESTLAYGPGTTIKMEWRKINDEVWLPSRIHTNCVQIETVSWLRDRKIDFVTSSSRLEKDLTFSEYKKFRVETRILPPH
jgi:hypothetical protein